jgi:hypothetical protein
MIIPDEIRLGIRSALWENAEAIGWANLNDSERSRMYERWTVSPSIGGKLAHFMDPRKVRVYIKDSLIKPYERARLLAAEHHVWDALGIPPPSEIEAVFIKPHGCRTVDGMVVCWGNSRDWKLILMAAFERAYAGISVAPYGVVFIETGKTAGLGARDSVREAASRLGIQRTIWLD